MLLNDIVGEPFLPSVVCGTISQATRFCPITALCLILWLR